MDQYDLVPSGLIDLLSKHFNQGVDFAGKKFGEPTGFFIGGALNLNPPKLSREVKVLHKKIEAGVDFLLTQPVFEVETVDAFRRAYEAEYGDLQIPIIAGLMPLRDAKHAAFLHNEIPGITVPDVYLKRMEDAGSKAAEEGLEIVMELAVRLKPHVQGIYLMPFQRHQAAGKIIDAIRAG
jgi:homocysteine S-methyltransferase